MRAGTHYVLDALARVYHGRVAKLKDDVFAFVGYDEINKGLYQSESNIKYSDKEAAIFHCHYYHTIPHDERLIDTKNIYLIGYPFDSFFSDGLVFSSKEYSVAPSLKNERYEKYKFLYKSDEWNFLEPFMHKNASWLEWLIKHDDLLVIRYEDFFIDFRATIKRIEEYCGAFKEEFPSPIKNKNRIYWTDSYVNKMDEDAFLKLKQLFLPALNHFYPEKKPFNYK